MGEQGRGSSDGQPVGEIGAGVDAQLRQAGAGGGHGHPIGSGKDQQGATGPVEHLPALGRVIKYPGTGLPGGDFCGMPGPGAGGAGRHDPGFAGQRRDGRRGDLCGFHHWLHQGIEPVEGVVMGNVLERLPRHDEGQGKARCLIHEKWLQW